MVCTERRGFIWRRRRMGSRRASGRRLQSQVSGLKAKEIVTIPLLVRNRTGYQNLCRLITLMKLRVPKHAKPGECAVTPEELAAHAQGLICLTGADDGPLAKAVHHRDTESTEAAQRIAEWLVYVF